MMSRFPGASLLHPLFLVSLLVLLINDHIAKDLYPGVITGKLSDFSGLLVLPVLAFVAVEVGAKATRRRLPRSARGSRALHRLGDRIRAGQVGTVGQRGLPIRNRCDPLAAASVDRGRGRHREPRASR